MQRYIVLLLLGLLVTQSYGLRAGVNEEEEELTEEEVEETLNLRLPGYVYCGTGNDVLQQMRNWRQNVPINKLDLACFYHDLVYTDINATPEEIREGDLLLRNRAQEIYNGLGGWFFSNWKYKAELQIVIKAINAKIAMENKGLVDPRYLVSKDPTRVEQVYEVLEENNLPDAWGLPYSFYIVLLLYSFIVLPFLVVQSGSDRNIPIRIRNNITVCIFVVWQYHLYHIIGIIILFMISVQLL